jgi:hypothetical protein
MSQRSVVFYGVALGLVCSAALHYDFLRYLPGFECEGWNCARNDSIYLALVALISLVFFSVIATTSPQIRRWHTAAHGLLAFITSAALVWYFLENV